MLKNNENISITLNSLKDHKPSGSELMTPIPKYLYWIGYILLLFCGIIGLVLFYIQYTTTYSAHFTLLNSNQDSYMFVYLDQPETTKIDNGAECMISFDESIVLEGHILQRCSTTPISYKVKLKQRKKLPSCPLDKLYPGKISIRNKIAHAILMNKY